MHTHLNPKRCNPFYPPNDLCVLSSERLASECRQNEACSVNILVIVSAQLLFLFDTPAPQRLLDIAFWIFAADHESDLARWVGWDSGVRVFDNREDFFAGLLQGRDQWQMKPLVFS